MAGIQKFEEVADPLTSVTEALLRNGAASSWLIVASGSGALGLDEAAGDFEQASGEHVGVGGAPDSRPGLARMGWNAVSAKVLMHPRMVENASLGFEFMVNDTKSVLPGDSRDAVAVNDVPANTTKRCEPEPRYTLVHMLGHAADRG